MSAARSLSAVALLAGLALAACSQPAPEGGAGSAPTAEPAVLTEAQKTALLAELPEPYRSADLAKGEALYAMCRSCHTYVQGGTNLTGPNLWGTFGAKAAHVAGFNYSDALKASGLTWDVATMDKWIENPRGLVEGTKMSYVGMKSPDDRAALIAFLKVNTSPAK
ncbi:c-type cytochrome [Phenylobacterium parvum]|uniref:Cytochrome c family protein n=1 Tax=Phenylobacterium parvum TaxID=2201350 RepID=A0A2Z3HR01_9CAUL|nr:cytochrome c family protein [Phenylobacterium parvum]AWM77225.1 cytochrome c family protein [Phenylobacterium parvum]